jgi:hypothetical protein
VWVEAPQQGSHEMNLQAMLSVQRLMKPVFALGIACSVWAAVAYARAYWTAGRAEGPGAGPA